MKKKDREALIEQVSFLTALQKKVKEYLDAHSEDSPRSELDSMVRDMYQGMGVSKLDLKVRGQKVGTVSARLSKPVHEIKPMIENGTEFLDWLLTSDGGKDTLSRLIAQSLLQPTENSLTAAGWLNVMFLNRGSVPPFALTPTR